MGSWMGAPVGLLATESLGEGTTPGEAAGGSHGEVVPCGPPQPALIWTASQCEPGGDEGWHGKHCWGPEEDKDCGVLRSVQEGWTELSLGRGGDPVGPGSPSRRHSNTHQAGRLGWGLKYSKCYLVSWAAPLPHADLLPQNLHLNKTRGQMGPHLKSMSFFQILWGSHSPQPLAG